MICLTSGELPKPALKPKWGWKNNIGVNEFRFFVWGGVTGGSGVAFSAKAKGVTLERNSLSFSIYEYKRKL